MAKVLFKRYETDLEAQGSDVIDGQFIVTKEGTSYIDYGEDRIPTNGTPDNAMSSSSQNTVQNKVIKEYVDSGVQEVKDYVHNKSATFTCSQTGGLTMSNSYQAFPLDTQTNNVSGLTLRSDSGIEIGEGISYIKISAATAANAIASTITRLSVFKNNNIIARTQMLPYSFFSLSLVNKVIPVTSGDVIYLKANADGSSAGDVKLAYVEDVTWLTIEVLN